MPLRFDQVRQPRPRLLPRTPAVRVVAMCLTLVLVVGAMARLETREAHSLLGLLFGGELESSDEQIAANRANDTELPAVDGKRLQSVTDNTYFRAAETDAWFHLIAIARDASPQAMAASSVGSVIYAQLINQPGVYRGRVVTVVGEAARIDKVTPSANDLGIDTMYRVIVRPAGGDLLPIFVYVLELPAGFSPETIPEHRASFQGFFFKNQSHRDSLGVSISPVLVARSFEATLVAPPEQGGPAPWPLWQLVATAALFAAGVVLWIWLRPFGQPRARHVERVDLSGLSAAEMGHAREDQSDAL
jgi:hypothetical protein